MTAAALGQQAPLISAVRSREEKYQALTTSKSCFSKVRPRATHRSHQDSWLNMQIQGPGPGLQASESWCPGALENHLSTTCHILLGASLRGQDQVLSGGDFNLARVTSCSDAFHPTKAHMTYSTPDMARLLRKAFLSSARPPNAMTDWGEGRKRQEAGEGRGAAGWGESHGLSRPALQLPAVGKDCPPCHPTRLPGLPAML